MGDAESLKRHLAAGLRTLLARMDAAGGDPASAEALRELRAAVADLSSTIEREASRRTLAGSDPRRELDSGFEAASELYRDLVAGAPAPETSSASASPSAEAPWRLGDFEILRRVGGGGMGDVYLARQVSLGREVALKLLSPHIAGDAKSTERFLREAKAAASTNHPSIVPVLQAGIEGGRPYIAMQYIHGVSLQELLEAGPLLDVKRALEIARDAVRATEAAHAAGVIHRDIKPGNVLLESDPSSVRRAGRVFLADFGLASLSDRGSITATGEILGTPAYMSPEQARGLPAVRSSDIYSLGATLYAMLAGRPPHEGSNHAAIIAGVAQREPVPIRKLRPSVDRDAATICEKAMRWEPDRRYATAGEMADDIDRWLARKPIRARPASTAYRVRLWLRRNPRAMVAAVLIVVAVLAALAGERLLRRRGTLAAVDDLLRRGEAEEARERLETVPGIWPLRDSAVASLECRLFLQLGDLGRAAEAAARLAASKRAAEFAAIREIVDRQLAASESLILDGAWWAALEFVWETIGGIEVLSREAGGDPAWSDWIDSASVKALHVAASALIQAGEYELAVRIWEGDRARDRPVRIREVLTELVGVRAEGEPSLDEIGGFARRLTRCVTSVRFSRHARMVLESGGVQQGCTGARRKALLGLAEQKALEHALSRDEGRRAETRILLRILLAYPHLLDGRESSTASAWLRLLERLRPEGESLAVPGARVRAIGDIDGDGVKDLVCAEGNVIEVIACRKEGVGASGRLEIEKGTDVYSIALRDLDGDARDEIIALVLLSSGSDQRGPRCVVRAFHLKNGIEPFGEETGPILGFPESPGFALAVSDVTGDAEVEVIIGTGSAQAEEMRSLVVVQHPFTGRAERRVLPDAGRPGDIMGVFAGDFDRDGRNEVGCVSGPWQGFDIRLWKFAEQAIQGPLRFGPLGAFESPRILEVGDSGEPALLVGMASSYSYNEAQFPEPPHTGIENGLYLFRLPRDRPIRDETVPCPPGRSQEIFAWSDVLSEQLQDPPDYIAPFSISTGRGTEGETAFAATWRMRRAGRLIKFTDLYFEGRDAGGSPADAFSKHRVLWRDREAEIDLELVALRPKEDSPPTPGLVLFEKASDVAPWTAQLFSFAGTRREETETAFYLDLMRAYGQLGRTAEALSLVQSTLRDRLTQEGAARFAAGWAMAAASELDGDSLRLALQEWDRMAGVAGTAGLDKLIDSLRRAARDRAALNQQAPAIHVGESEVRLDAFEPSGWKGSEICLGPIPVAVGKPSNMRLSFDLDVDTLGWDRGVFVGLVPTGGDWKSDCISYGIEIYHGGGAGQALRHVFFRWGKFVFWELDLGKRIVEGKSYRIALERTGEGRVHLKVEDLVTGGTSIAETIPRYDWGRVLQGTEDGPRPLPLGPPPERFDPLPEGENEFGIFGWTKRPRWRLSSGTHLLVRSIELRIASSDAE